MGANEQIVSLRRRIHGLAGAYAGDTILRAMGYRRITPERRARLDAVLTSDLLGLEAGGFDFRYDAEDFVCALCDVLNIAPADYRPGLAAMKSAAETRRAFAPYVRIDTDFRRTTQPIFILGMLEGRRRIQLPSRVRDLSPIEQIQHVGGVVADHFASHTGQLEFWGRITGYRFVYEPGSRVVFDTQGQVEAIGPTPEDDPLNEGASLSVRGRDLSRVLG